MHYLTNAATTLKTEYSTSKLFQLENNTAKLRLHPESSVYADDFSVEHWVPNNRLN